KVKMSYQTYIPCDALKPYVRSFAIAESIEEGSYKILPDTGIVIGFQYKGKLSYFDNSNEVALSAAGITGLRDSYRTFRNAANTGTVLVYFKEAGAATFFRQPIHELFRESVSLENFMLRSELLVTEEQLAEASTHSAKIEVIEQFLLARMQSTTPDQMVLSALALIHKSKGTIRIRELAQQLYISQGALEKRFRKVAGASPKKFAGIVRIKHILQKYDASSSLTSLGYEAGFYDQAHFIKEFKAFTGETPDTFFSAK
ncbi:MAG TPA: helix-turn-helix domain-containing protein, partial [Chitinophagaceae bacterium]|nr:helix-turn-helix domain-containing protein [Chitinophagaceae bacterium]